MVKSKIIKGISIMILFIVSILFSINGLIQTALVLCIVASILLLLWVKNIMGNYTNLSLFFVAFSVLYGVSGPINAIWGEEIHRLFTVPYRTDAFLISYAIANIGLLLGILVYNLIGSNKKPSSIYMNNRLVSENRMRISNLAIFMAICASLLEIINIFRIGGISTVFMGKATYQSLISSLKFTMPSTELIVVAFSLMGLYLGVVNTKKDINLKVRLKVLFFLLGVSPYLLLKMMLGQRGMLLSLFLCLFIGITLHNPIKKIKPKLLMILIILYIFMTFLYANRAIVKLIPENPKEFMRIAFQKERFVKALNPGSNEFGAAFGNYSEFYHKYGHDFKPRLGETYIKGLVIPIPSFVYPGTKPQQITYQFRDEFFPSEATRGGIAGTAFSSILEAYMNFKYTGVFIIYFLIGILIQRVDRIYRYKSLFFTTLYIASFSQVMSFHRSAFGDIFGAIALRAIVIILFLGIKLNVNKNGMKRL